MTKKPACLPPRHTAIDALRLMRDGGFRHVPVVENGVVVGVVSRGDFRATSARQMDPTTRRAHQRHGGGKAVRGLPRHAQ